MSFTYTGLMNAVNTATRAATPDIAPQGRSFLSGLRSQVSDGLSATLNNGVRAGFDSLNERIGGGQALPEGIGKAPTTHGRDGYGEYIKPVAIALGVMAALVLVLKIAK